MIGLWLSVALASDDLQAQLHALTANKHACDDAIPALDARLAVHPEDLEARLRRADCRYQVGRLAWALEDVERVLAVEESVEARVLHVVLLSRGGRLGEARRGLRRLPADTPGRSRAEGVVLAAGGDLGGAWGAVDAALVRWPTDPEVLRLAGEVAALDPDGLTPAAAAALERPERFAQQYNRAVQRLNVGDGAGCLVILAEAEGLVGSVERPLQARLGHQCAAQAGELERAAALLAEAGGVEAADPSAVLRQAELLRRAGRTAEALVLFEGVVPVTGEQLMLQATGRVVIHREAGQLDEALEVADDGRASAASRANLAVALREADRDVEALALLEGACPDMEGEGAVRCWQTLSRWRGE